MILGIVTFLFLGWSLRDLERAKVVRYLAVAAGVGFLVITLLFGTEYDLGKQDTRPFSKLKKDILDVLKIKI